MVVQNYENGHVIALASYPTFDNRWFESDLGDGKFEQVFPTVVDPVTGKVDPDTSMLTNRAIQGRYNLGSTFKPFTAYAALNTGLIGINDYYQDTGRYTMESVAEDKCNSGLVRCVYKNATCSGTQRPCVYGNVDVETALAVSSDAFFYRLGELLMTQNNNRPVLQEQVRLFGFGSDPGIDLPFAFDGTVPDKALKKEYADLGVISEDEGQDYFTGDNVQLAIGQGLLSASPLQFAVGYSTIANSGFVMKPEIIMAIYQPGVPDAHASGYADLSQARLAEDPNVDGEVIRQVPMVPEIRNEIVNGLHRVIYGPRHQQRPVPQHHRREPLPLLPVERHPDRRQDRHRPGRGQLSVERLVGVRRVQHRSDPARTRSPPTSRRPGTVRRPPDLWSNACSCSCPATPTPTRSCCPISSTRRRTSPPNRGSLSDTSCFNGRFGATTGVE